MIARHKVLKQVISALLLADAASWLLVAFSVATTLSAVLQRVAVDPSQSSQHVIELNVGELFAVTGVMSILMSDHRSRPALEVCDLAVLILCAMTWLAPEAHAVYGGMSIVGAWFALRHRRDIQLSSVGRIWFALSFYELWGKLLFKIFYQNVESLEVTVMFYLGSLFFPEISRAGMDLSVRGDWSVVILEGCSSFHNLSLAALIWLSVLGISNRRPDSKTLSALAVSSLLVIVINVGRILAMLPSQDAYLFWHDGLGATWVAVASVLAAVVPVSLCIERTGIVI